MNGRQAQSGTTLPRRLSARMMSGVAATTAGGKSLCDAGSGWRLAHVVPTRAISLIAEGGPTATAPPRPASNLPPPLLRLCGAPIPRQRHREDNQNQLPGISILYSASRQINSSL